mmetsp:Transcript_100018/g.137678  ORF Transcript_100018/g.137678 Transcript_100018/m.137678 type:complete len:311 (-) Transcript_100018:44-976(-)
MVMSSIGLGVATVIDPEIKRVASSLISTAVIVTPRSPIDAPVNVKSTEIGTSPLSDVRVSTVRVSVLAWLLSMRADNEPCDSPACEKLPVMVSVSDRLCQEMVPESASVPSPSLTVTVIARSESESRTLIVAEPMVSCAFWKMVPVIASVSPVFVHSACSRGASASLMSNAPVMTVRVVPYSSSFNSTPSCVKRSPMAIPGLIVFGMAELQQDSSWESTPPNALYQVQRAFVTLVSPLWRHLGSMKTCAAMSVVSISALDERARSKVAPPSIEEVKIVSGRLRRDCLPMVSDMLIESVMVSRFVPEPLRP